MPKRHEAIKEAIVCAVHIYVFIDVCIYEFGSFYINTYIYMHQGFLINT